MRKVGTPQAGGCCEHAGQNTASSSRLLQLSVAASAVLVVPNPVKWIYAGYHNRTTVRREPQPELLEPCVWLVLTRPRGAAAFGSAAASAPACLVPREGGVL